MVVNAVPFHFTTEPLIKLLPFTVSVKAETPAVTDVGEMLLSTGAGLFAAVMVNVAPLLVPPPGAGLNMVTVADPAVLIFVADTVAVNCVLLIYVVAKGMPFQFTTAPSTKAVPLTVNVNVAPPAVADVGVKLLSVGV